MEGGTKMDRITELLSISQDDAMNIHEIVESTGLTIKECRRLIELIKNCGIPLACVNQGYYLRQPYRWYNGKVILIPMPPRKEFDLQMGDKVSAILRWWDNPYRSRKTVTVQGIYTDVFLCTTDKGIKTCFPKKDYEFNVVVRA